MCRIRQEWFQVGKETCKVELWYQGKTRRWLNETGFLTTSPHGSCHLVLQIPSDLDRQN